MSFFMKKSNIFYQIRVSVQYFSQFIRGSCTYKNNAGVVRSNLILI